MVRNKQFGLLSFLLLLSFMTMFATGTAFAHDHGGGGGGSSSGGDGGKGDGSSGVSDSDTGAATFVSLQDANLADYEEASLFDQYNEGLDRIEGENLRFERDADRNLRNNQRTLAWAEFFAWLADSAEASGDKRWGGMPNTIEVGSGPPGSPPVKIEGEEIPNAGIAAPGPDGTPPSLSDFGPSIVWNSTLNTTRTLGYGMLGGNNRTTYNINQRSRTGRAINNFIANLPYRGRQSLDPNGGKHYNVLGGDLNEVPRTE